ncbi:gluconokinase [Caldovatus sediminis]|uniref:gluconokinase n=1 Tax=Caldovatus sediminis TaxID=2041189 RepID=A0A8J2ZAL3_9PROT|nr:shikimate kinase [Caldovatus sediminis]GGG29187.1 gluconokinase [Caldovatus sediminis]
MTPPRIVVMGVSGAGKSTVGPLLAAALGVPFADGDAFHPPANVAKMAAGTPLTDADRWPWLAAIADWLAARVGHFMPAALLESQFATLEDPAGEPDVIAVSVAPAPGLIVREVLAAL